MSKDKVLFVCIHNSARSQMAEALLKKMAGDRFEAESAGLEPGTLNPLAVEVMKEIGIDISQNKTKSAFDLFKEGRLYTHVITVCDETSAEQCPFFPGITTRLHWSFADPSSFTGTHEEKLEKTRQVREAIKERIEAWLKELETRNDPKS
jgi:arsenate reductase (thioredoxin)